MNKLLEKHGINCEIDCWRDRGEISQLIGHKVIDIHYDDEIFQILTETHIFTLYHESDCCEHVYLQDIVGEVSDLIGNEILKAEESTSDENPLCCGEESFTWTFYKFATIKGYVDLRWYGSSNGYYSESVDVLVTKLDK